MRLWSLHPQLLDAKGLVALWREGLLAKKVLAGETRGYKHHPQLIRFQCVDGYLAHVLAEARARGYNFNESKIDDEPEYGVVEVTKGQLAYEYAHLEKKIVRTPGWLLGPIRANPFFHIVPGPVADWERT